MIQRYGAAVRTAGGELPFTPLIAAGDFLFASGQVAFDETGRIVGDNIDVQTTQTLENLYGLLKLAGAEKEDLVRVNVWLTRQEDFPAFNAAYSRFMGEARPTRSTVRSDLLIPGALIELDAIAYRQRSE